MKKYAMIFFPIVFMASCICEPAPEGMQIQDISSQSYISRYDSNITVSILLEPKYRRIINRNKQFGCLGYHKITGFYYIDTLQISTLELTCNENIGSVRATENWLGHTNTIAQYSAGPGYSVTQNIKIHQVLDVSKYKQLADSSLFRLKYRNSNNDGFEDSFYVQFVK